VGRVVPLLSAITVFSDLTAQIELAFILAYPTPQAAAQLTWAEFQAFAAEHRYTPSAKLPAAFARLQHPQPAADADTVATFQAEAEQLARLLLPMVQAKQTQLHDLTKLFKRHPDAAIFDSLPGAGELLAPGLLVKFGDDRQRFPMSCAFAKPAITSSAHSPNNGPKPVCLNRRGRKPIGKICGPIVDPIAPRIAASRIAGWRSCGNSGRRGNPMTKIIIFSNARHGANRARRIVNVHCNR